MDTSAFMNAVSDQSRIFADWIDGQDPATPVPTCPDWKLADLVDHVGAVQRMVIMLVGEQMVDPTDAFTRQATAPTDPADWPAWLTEGAAEARQAFAGVSDDTPVWDPSGAAAGVPFWSRRLFGEMCVHRADAAVALGRQYELPADQAVVATEDWLDTLTSPGYWEARPEFAQAMRGDGQTLHFHATDAAGDWLARREQDRVALERGEPDSADVVVSGPATDLMLVISRRRPIAEATSLDIKGDAAEFEHFVAHMDWIAD